MQKTRELCTRHTAAWISGPPGTGRVREELGDRTPAGAPMAGGIVSGDPANGPLETIVDGQHRGRYYRAVRQSVYRRLGVSRIRAASGASVKRSDYLGYRLGEL